MDVAERLTMLSSNACGSVKYEGIYLREYTDGYVLNAGLERYFCFYNTERPHSALGNLTPQVVHNAIYV